MMNSSSFILQCGVHTSHPFFIFKALSHTVLQTYLFCLSAVYSLMLSSVQIENSAYLFTTISQVVREKNAITLVNKYLLKEWAEDIELR